MPVAGMVVRTLAWVAAAWALLAALGYLFQRSVIYLPSRHDPGPIRLLLPGAEEVVLNTADGLRLGGWFLPVARSRTKATAIVFNGNAGDRALRAPLAEALARAGLSVLLFDYRGYGGNPGRPTEAGLAADAKAALACVTGRADVDASRLVYFGESLGAAVAVGLAADRPPAAVVLRSPFTRLADVGRVHFPFLPVQALLRDRYAAVDRIARIGCPLLVIAGDRDSVIPFAQSRALFDAAVQPKRFARVEGADHNDWALLGGPPLVNEVVTFLEDFGLADAGNEEAAIRDPS